MKHRHCFEPVFAIPILLKRTWASILHGRKAVVFGSVESLHPVLMYLVKVL